MPEYDSYNFEIVSEDILRVIDSLGIKSACFVSLSLGSILLQKLDEMRPQLVERMVTAGGIFKPNLKIHLFAHAGKFLSYVLSYRQIYKLFSWVVMPKKNHEKPEGFTDSNPSD
jgi:pimeloyl-ACP methyl ester carboxylesterase